MSLYGAQGLPRYYGAMHASRGRIAYRYGRYIAVDATVVEDERLLRPDPQRAHFLFGELAKNGPNFALETAGISEEMDEE